MRHFPEAHYFELTEHTRRGDSDGSRTSFWLMAIPSLAGLTGAGLARRKTSGQNVVNHVSMHIRQPEIASLVPESRLFVVNTELMQNRRI